MWTPAFSQVAGGQNNPDSASATLVFTPSPRDTTAKKTAAPALVPLSPNAITHIVHYLSEDSVTFDIRERRAQLHNNGSILYDDMTLEADDIQVDFNRQMLYARPLADSNGKVRGHPFFKQGEAEYIADTIAFNYNTKRGLISTTPTPISPSTSPTPSSSPATRLSPDPLTSPSKMFPPPSRSPLPSSP